uniref:Uncharacterized protein n=1 Tax=Anopheles coluzzii TaxID=1518534 RepID=A0A8W7PK34_ANOCL
MPKTPHQTTLTTNENQQGGNFHICHTAIRLPARLVIDVTIGLVTLPAPSGGPPAAPASFGQRRWRRRLREAGRANAAPNQPEQQPETTEPSDRMKYLTAGHRESYTLVARKREGIFESVDVTSPHPEKDNIHLASSSSTLSLSE